MDSPTGRTDCSWMDTLAKCGPCRTVVTMSSTSRVVLAGRMMSAYRQSFSSHGCCATMHSMLSSFIASMVQLPWFQQVMRHGVSVHIMWMRTCLLYTSDAADEEDSVDLGGRR